jgi:uncharacterized repeat protein (TIGR03803 family)
VQTASGTVFSLSPPAVPGESWTENTLYTFGAFSGDAAIPAGGLVIDGAGVLYGVTEAGGSHGSGTVFSLAPPATPGEIWTETVLHSFAGSPDGSFPNSALVPGAGGEYFGTTSLGGIAGNNSQGVVFSLAPPNVAGGAWTESVLYRFHGAGDGGGPAGLLYNPKTGSLYGTALSGGANADGVLFALKPPAVVGGAWTEHVLHSFDSLDGRFPDAGPIEREGVLYGSTVGGGTEACPCGTVYAFTP